MKQAIQRIENLEIKISELDKQSKAVERSQLANEIEATPPPLQPKSPSARKKRRSKNAGNSLTPNSSKLDVSVVPSPPAKPQATSDSDLLSHSDRPKSSSYGDLTTVGAKEEKSTSEFKLPNTPQVSPANAKKNLDRKLNRRESSGSERSTITSLVAESLNNPGSMLAIKKELKSDSFTPKIQRKFRQKASPGNATLVPVHAAMNGGSDLAKEGKTMK